MKIQDLAKIQQEYEKEMLLEQTAIADHKEAELSEYRQEQREIDAEYENWRNEQPN